MQGPAGHDQSTEDSELGRAFAALSTALKGLRAADLTPAEARALRTLLHELQQLRGTAPSTDA